MLPTQNRKSYIMKKFNASPIVSAILLADKAQGGFVRAIIEAREANPKTKPDTMVQAIADGLVAVVEAGDIEASSAKQYVTYAKTMIECKLETLLDAVVEGYGITGVLRRIRAVEGKRSKAGRKPGTTGGTQAQVEASEASEAKVEASTETDPRQFIQDLLARAVKVVDIADVDRFTNAGLEMMAMLSKKMGKAAK